MNPRQHEPTREPAPYCPALYFHQLLGPKPTSLPSPPGHKGVVTHLLVPITPIPASRNQTKSSLEQKQTAKAFLILEDPLNL
jgi:hypothetical protein